MKSIDELKAQYSAQEAAIRGIEDRVEQMDKWAKECADKGDYSGAGNWQKSAVDLHCAVAIIKNAIFPHHHSMPGFDRTVGDICPGCELDAMLAERKA